MLRTRQRKAIVIGLGLFLGAAVYLALEDPFQGARRKMQSLAGGPNGLPSTSVMRDVELSPDWHYVSVVADEQLLNDPELGIIANYKKKGRAWERPAYMSYFYRGRLAFSSGVGLRVHGGRHRKKMKSFRLYFRGAYGAKQLPSGILWPENEGPVRTLVVRRDRHYGRLLVNCLAFDIARQIGARTPDYVPALFYLNGKFMGAYCLSDHLSRRQFQMYFGHDDFYLYRRKGHTDEASERAYKDLLRWCRNFPAPMTMDAAREVVDLDEMCRTLLAVMFLGVTDWTQGAAILDLREEAPKWSWVMWDLDQSFKDLRAGANKRSDWMQEVVELMFSSETVNGPKEGVKWIDGSVVRPVLFLRLWKEDPSFREWFLRLAVDTLNHRIPPDFLLERIDAYVRLLNSIGREGARVTAMEDFLLHRHGYVRKSLAEYFDRERCCRCRIAGPEGVPLEVDGFAEETPYTGWYFEGQMVSARVASGEEGPDAWIVNGERLDGPDISLRVTQDIDMEPLFRGSESGSRISEMNAR